MASRFGAASGKHQITSQALKVHHKIYSGSYDMRFPPAVKLALFKIQSYCDALPDLECNFLPAQSWLPTKQHGHLQCRRTCSLSRCCAETACNWLSYLRAYQRFTDCFLLRCCAQRACNRRRSGYSRAFQRFTDCFLLRCCPNRLLAHHPGVQCRSVGQDCRGIYRLQYLSKTRPVEGRIRPRVEHRSVGHDCCRID